MTDALQKLFGSEARTKLLRLFLFNPRASFTAPQAAQRARVKERDAKREIKLFSDITLIKRARRPARAVGKHFILNSEFAHVALLQQLLLNAPEHVREMYERLRRVGALKLVVLSGIFVNEWEARLDLLVVGDRMQDRKLRDFVRRLDSELGRELRYASLSTDDFLYRLGMNDHLIRDIFDYPHIVVHDKLNLGLK